MKTQLVRHSTNYRNNVHEIITRVWSAETGAFSYNTSANYKQRALSKFTSVLTLYDVSSCTLLTSNNTISRTWKFFKVQFCCLWKIYSCLLTPNCTRNRVITYTSTNRMIITKASQDRKGHKEPMRAQKYVMWPNWSAGKREWLSRKGNGCRFALDWLEWKFLCRAQFDSVVN